jgi:hypothetical protein
MFVGLRLWWWSPLNENIINEDKTQSKIFMISFSENLKY